MFQPDISSNTRDRPKGSLGGLAQTLTALDRMLSRECNQQAIFDVLEKELQADPARCNVVVPLFPRSTREALPHDANDDWLPLDRHPQSQPPSDPGSPPTASAWSFSSRSTSATPRRCCRRRRKVRGSGKRRSNYRN